MAPARICVELSTEQAVAGSLILQGGDARIQRGPGGNAARGTSIKAPKEWTEALERLDSYRRNAEAAAVAAAQSASTDTSFSISCKYLGQCADESGLCHVAAPAFWSPPVVGGRTKLAHTEIVFEWAVVSQGKIFTENVSLRYDKACGRGVHVPGPFKLAVRLDSEADRICARSVHRAKRYLQKDVGVECMIIGRLHFKQGMLGCEAAGRDAEAP